MALTRDESKCAAVLTLENAEIVASVLAGKMLRYCDQFANTAFTEAWHLAFTQAARESDALWVKFIREVDLEDERFAFWYPRVRAMARKSFAERRKF
jgi:hypothetical protein